MLRFLMDPKFPEKLIKGKIAEAIFQQMFKEQGEFIVIPNGYEYTKPELAQSLLSLDHKEYVEKLRHSPDFVLLSYDRKQVFLVDVKFRSKIGDELIEKAKKYHDEYGACYLFVATHDRFYFESCTNIVNSGKIDEELPISWISQSLQDKYLEILNKFIV